MTYVEDGSFAITIAGQYSRYLLTVNSIPSSIPFQLDGIELITPYTEDIIEGSHVITIPPTVDVDGIVYDFLQWEDGSTMLTRTFELTSNLTITATYEEHIEHDDDFIISIIILTALLGGILIIGGVMIKD